MSTSVSWPPIGGTSYSVPAAGEVNWQALSNFLIALGNKAQSIDNTKLAIRVATTSPVSVVSNTDCVVVVDLAVAGAVAVNLPAGVTGQVFFIVDGKGDAATNNITIDGNGAETINGAANYVVNKNRAGVLVGFNGTGWTVLSEFTNIAAGTIPRSSIAAGSANHVVINDGSGFLSSEAQLAKSRGGTGADNSSVTFPASGTVVTEAGTQTLTGKTIDGDDNTIQDVAITSLKTVLGDANEMIRRDSTGAVVSGPVTASDTGAVGGVISTTYDEVAAPATPASGKVVIYAKSDGKMYGKDDAGVESALTAASVATPTASGTITSFTPVVASQVNVVTGAGYTITTTDGYGVISVNSSGSARTVTLPAASSNIGRTITVQKSDSSTTGVITVTRAGSDAIEGAGNVMDPAQNGISLALPVQYSAYTLVATGSGTWRVIGQTPMIGSINSTFSFAFGGSGTSAGTVSISFTRIGDMVTWGTDSGVTATVVSAPQGFTADTNFPDWARPRGSNNSAFVLTVQATASALLINTGEVTPAGQIRIFRNLSSGAWTAGEVGGFPYRISGSYTVLT